MREFHKIVRTPDHLRIFIIMAVIQCSAGANASPGMGRSDSVTSPIIVKSGWNVLSLPVAAGRSARDSLFPNSVSGAYRFNIGYAIVDTLENGYGFWLKFPEAETIRVTGTAQYRDTIAVHEGWNLIGGISTTVAVGNVETVPPGIIISKYFSFNPESGYGHSDTLTPGMGYWVKTNHAGFLVLTSLDVSCPGISVVEYGGRTYHTVQIADQCWLRENIDVGKWVWAGLQQEDNGTVEKYCWIDDSLNCTKFGGLYQWNEAMQYTSLPGARGICPPGWHIPTLGEFQGLDTTVAGDGNRLKAVRQGVDSGAGTNTTGFSALLSAYRHLDGTFSIFGYSAYFWTSTQQGPTTASSLYLFHSYNDLYFYIINKGYGFGIRCLKD